MTLTEKENNLDPAAFYASRRKHYSDSLAKARRASALHSNARFLIFIGCLIVVLVLGYLGLYLLTAGALVLGIISFTVLVLRHERIESAILVEDYLHSIQVAGEARLTGKWKDFADRGDEFADEKHPYANDLDLFGRASFFQWTNAAETCLGRQKLAEYLKVGSPVRLEIEKRQSMVKELANQAIWRQDFQAAGKGVVRAKEKPEDLMGWAEGETGIKFAPVAILAIRTWGLIVPACALIFGFFTPIPALAALPAFLNAMVIYWFSARSKPVIASLCLQRTNLQAYQNMLRLIEEAKFNGPGLVALAATVKDGKVTGSRQAQELVTIAEWLDVRANPLVHFVLNFLFLWDLQWLIGFQGWKLRSGKALRMWLECIATLEALSSLAAIRFENPDWCFPSFSEGGQASVRAESLGHPLLLSRDRVRNDFTLGDPGCGLILTGSNMTGKSTWLRTVGINLAMAYTGAPVCARELSTHLFHLHTSMRLHDDLDQGISSFYAELLRLRGLLDAARSGGQVLFLVDEIFRGTNSVDRVAGAIEVLLQLARLGCTGIVSTHDLELGRLAESHPNLFRNGHFSEHFEDGKIRFDFRLQSGISTTRNAIHLMRLAGVTPPE